MDNALESTITKLFVYTDQQNWDELKGVFAEKVLLDYSSFTGVAAAELAAEDIVAAWSGFLPGFESTHHQIGNFLIDSDGKTAKVFCYGTASHYLSNDSGNNVWIVVGSYDFELTKTEGDWRVQAMKFNFKYQDGNTGLPQLVQENAKKEK